MGIKFDRKTDNNKSIHLLHVPFYRARGIFANGFSLFWVRTQDDYVDRLRIILISFHISFVYQLMAVKN
jgi:hypothetical protein